MDLHVLLRARLPAAFLSAIVLVVSGGIAHAACPPDSRIEERVLANGLCLSVATFGAEAGGAAPVLVVVVHGDISDGGLATYHVAFAKTIVRPGVVAVALTRPGYTDETGRASEGSTFGRQDNYTPANIAVVANAIAAFKQHYRPRRIIYVGHSGGAAIGGVLIAKWPNLVDAAVIVSCPCNIPRWLARHGRPRWRYSLSPSTYAGRVPRTTTVIAITGTKDENTFPGLAEDYVNALARRGVAARFVPVENAGHGFSGVADATRAVLDEIIRAQN